MGDRVAPRYLPGAGPWIQQIYPNSFRSVWEYEEAFYSEEIDWRSEIGLVCPICGGECGYREIEAYYREVRELWPFRSGRIPVARFQCRGTAGRFPTFSMLPHQLVPYHRYTIGAMVQALLVCREYWQAGSGSAYLLAEELDTEAGGESGLTSSLLRLWGVMFQSWLRRAQSELAWSYDFCSVSFHDDLPSMLDELFGYFESLSRGPPGRGEAVVACVHEHGRKTGRFLFGVPSQGR